jgi:hypothetical protein
MGQLRDDASSGVAPFGYESDLTRGSAEISKSLAALLADRSPVLGGYWRLQQIAHSG